MRTHLRQLAASSWTDVALAIAGAGITQVRILQHFGGWSYGRLWLPVLVALAPLLIAIRRIDPLLAVVGMTAAAYGSLLLGQVDWVLLAGCLMALWSLPKRCGNATALIVIAIVSTVPLLLDGARIEVMTTIYPTVFSQLEEGGRILGMPQDEYSKILSLDWPWWQSILFLLAGLIAVLVSRSSGRTLSGGSTAGQRLDDLQTFVLRQNQVLADALLAVAATSLILVDLWRDQANGNWWSAPHWMPYAVAYAALTLVMRRRWPLIPLSLLAVGALLAYWQTSESWSVLLALAVALYSLAIGRLSIGRIAVIAIVVLGALPAVAALIRYPQATLLFPELKHTFVSYPNGRVQNFVYDGLVARQWPVLLSVALLLPASTGVWARLHRRNRAATARQAELERLTVEHEKEQVVLTERSSIARDLHDVVAHAVNLIVIQAETGPDLIARGDLETLAGFQRISDAGRRALGELDRMLSALRDVDGPDPRLSPQPGLAELRRLVSDMPDGLVVDLDLEGDLDRPAAGRQLAAYRLIQEALTNVVKHAQAAKVMVTLHSGEDGIRLEVADDGVGFDLEVARSSGRHGLAGLRERVRVHGGTIDIKTAPGAGTVISAWIPTIAAIT